jgi:D-aminoacyl-tRNA deacylase
MNIIILASTLDQAGMNCAKHLKPHFAATSVQFDNHPVLQARIGLCDVYLCTTDLHTVYAEYIDERLLAALGLSNIDAIIFTTKHDSKSAVKTFCVHTQGNWGDAQLGGERGVVNATPVVLKNELFLSIAACNTVGFEVVNEATHHGPVLTVPSVFIEIGSTAAQWVDERLGAILADAVLSCLRAYTGETAECPPAVFLIGGTHTCANVNESVAKRAFFLGHICPSYAVLSLTSSTIAQGLQLCSKPCTVVLDWNGMNSAQKGHVTGLLSLMKIEWKKLKEMKVIEQ